MMAGAVVEKAVCESCGVAVREASSFCYNCGETISGIRADETTQAASSNGDAFKQPSSFQIDIPKSTEQLTEDEKPAALKPALADNTKLRSAASLKRNVKAYNRKPVEIIWVERERSPTAFIIVSIVLIMFTAVLLALAAYLK